MNFLFKKSQRLLSSRQFQEVNSSGLRRSGKYLIVHMKEVKTPKLGVTVAKQYGKAHERNRFKRLVREIYRTSPEVFSGFALNVKPKPLAKEVKLHELKEEFTALLRQ